MGKTPYFDKAILFMLENEDCQWRTAPKLENLHDGAGWTFIGITQRDDEKFLPNHLTVVEISEMYLKGDSETRQAALDAIFEVYYKKYWNLLYDQIKSYKTACRVFDFGVNRGPMKAVIALQNACNILMAETLALKVDGIFGEKTLNRVNSLIQTYGEDKLYNALVYQCRKQYSGVVDKNPNMGRFYNGWINRLEKEIK